MTHCVLMRVMGNLGDMRYFYLRLSVYGVRIAMISPGTEETGATISLGDMIFPFNSTIAIEDFSPVLSLLYECLVAS